MPVQQSDLTLAKEKREAEWVRGGAETIHGTVPEQMSLSSSPLLAHMQQGRPWKITLLPSKFLPSCFTASRGNSKKKKKICGFILKLQLIEGKREKNPCSSFNLSSQACYRMNDRWQGGPLGQADGKLEKSHSSRRQGYLT